MEAEEKVPQILKGRAAATHECAFPEGMENCLCSRLTNR